MALANALHSKEITTAQVSAVSFGFFTEDEVKKISVKNIVSPIIFDNMKNPIKGGLYDPALGPMEIKERCATCNLNSFECPGHFGHIELAVPLYNPLVFTTLYKLLRCTCLHCFKFRMSGVEAERYRQRLELLARGKLQKAQSLVVGSGAAAKRVGDQIIDEESVPEKPKGRSSDRSDPEPAHDVEGSSKRAMSGMGPRSPAHLTAQTLESMIETISEFFKKQPTGKCQNCGAHNPAIKREGHAKLFVMPLPSKKHAANVVQGTAILGILHATNALSTKQEDTNDQSNDEEDYKDKGIKQIADKTDLEDDLKDQMGRMEDKESDGEDAVDKLNMPKYLTPSEVQEIMRRLWQTSEPLLAYIYPADVARRRRCVVKKGIVPTQEIHKGYKDFFVQTILVTPNRFRPINRVGDAVYEHPQNTLLSKLINGNMDLVAASQSQSEAGISDPQAQLNRTLRQWMSLQNSLNALYDSSSADETHGVPGIRQQLEKKEGLFRKNMMGKRVNFAARSVISPDVYLNGGEIGIPPYFASRLTYPERVTPWNVERLREAVIAGPGRNPGAVAVEDERGRIVMLRKDKRSREAVARTLFASRNAISQHQSPQSSKSPSVPGGSGSPSVGGVSSEQYGGGKIVYRTMVDGDLMLTNRQPTLHKPGMMGHKARIMREERTIRFHYANCSTFNADFDGDEINLHLPQDHLGRTEGYEIVHADHQFFVPTDGKPLRGLIQDHIVAGTLLTMKDRFLTKSEYCQLIYECVAPDCSGAWEVWMEGPAVLKPTPLWTGKQVVTAILMHYTRDQLPFTMASNSKVPADTWGSNSGEGMFHVFRNHLVAGCIDKATFGKHGLLHVFYELYGADRTSLLTAALSRLLTGYIQQHGFTCGISDVALVESSEISRTRLLDTADVQCSQAVAEFVQLPGPRDLLDHGVSEEEAFTAREKDVRIALSMRFRSNSSSTGAALDMKVSSSMHPLSSDVVKACLPHGQAKPFRHNMMALMTVTGAKGSVVNFSQISCLLGQQELEGRRVPRMASGKTLPCFAPYDVGARSGGFVGDRFLTGLRPQEYYFHCMAGREGLVDTTVKTSRSGYLQRCLVKNLEALRVAYDGTVRDDCDASIVQFLYGEDGADTTLTGCLRTLPFLFYNMPQFSVQVEAGEAFSLACGQQGSEQQERYDEILSACRKQSKAVAKGKNSHKTLPVNACFFQSNLGVVPEGLQDAVTDALFGGLMLPPDPEGVDAAYKNCQKKIKKCTKKGQIPTFQALDAMDFQMLMHSKFYRSQAQPGEAVGVIAAQSVGEPSTQMTLNTFHMAGRGEANVTLGIPRLREILMTAAANIKTPVMTIPLRQDLGKEAARQLSVRLKRIYLAEALKGLSVQEIIVAKCHGMEFARGRTYAVRLQFHPRASYPAELGLEFEEIAAVFQSSFIPRLQAAVKAEIRKMSGDGRMDIVTSAKVGADDEFAVLANEDAAPKRKKRSEKDDEDENDEENEEFVEGKLRFSGGHGERATYDAGDEDDARIEREARQAAKLRFDEDTLEEDEERDRGSPVDADVDVQEGAEDEQGGDDAKGAQRRKSGQSQRGKQSANGLLAAESQVDESNSLCEVIMSVPLDAPKLLMREIAERVAARCVLRGVQGISKCYILDTSSKNESQSCIVQTDGINIHGLWESSDIIDATKLTTNSPAAMLEVLGVEAARATVVKEVSAVFGAYGIAVDPRHLSLIADHMTHMGNYRACNRIGIEASTSPFLKMSFETAASFLVSATLHGDIDPLKSPASRIVIGRPVQAGTGSMDLIHKLPSPVC